MCQSGWINTFSPVLYLFYLNHHILIAIMYLLFLITDLLSDDVTVAINCAKRVVTDPQGIAAW